MRRLSTLILALMLLLGQATLLAHEYDFAMHKGGDHCSVCLHATPLAGAAAGNATFDIAFISGTTRFGVAEERVSGVAIHIYHARAPPSL